MIFDTHCHAYWKGLIERIDEVKERMETENVVRSVQVGTNVRTNTQALSLARHWGENSWCAAAIHPSSCQDLPEEGVQDWIADLRIFIENNRDKVVAVGETGLDYYHLAKKRESFQKKVQRAYFRAHADLASSLGLPLIIHMRSATDDTLDLIKKCDIRKAVIHCFHEERAFAEECLKWSDDIYFSFSGILTYPREQALRETACYLPLERILVETDTPFLVPEAVRGTIKLNEPACTRYVLECLQQIRSESADVVEQTVWDNSNRFFGTDWKPFSM